jgi:hypothetical protein
MHSLKNSLQKYTFFWFSPKIFLIIIFKPIHYRFNVLPFGYFTAYTNLNVWISPGCISHSQVIKSTSVLLTVGGVVSFESSTVTPFNVEIGYTNLAHKMSYLNSWKFNAIRVSKSFCAWPVLILFKELSTAYFVRSTSIAVLNSVNMP